MKSLIEIQFEQMVSGIFNIKMEYAPGDIIGIIGENGIGKSSLFQAIKLQKPMMRMSFCDQLPMQPLGDLTAANLMDALFELRNIQLVESNWKNIDFIQKMNFETLMNRPIRLLSGGENQTLKLICCFLIDADVYFLDEPFNFLDDQKLNVVINEIGNLAKRKKTIFIIAHQLDLLRKVVCRSYKFYSETSQTYLKES